MKINLIFLVQSSIQPLKNLPQQFPDILPWALGLACSNSKTSTKGTMDPEGSA